MSDAIRQPGSPIQQQDLEAVRSEKFLKIYANAANIETTVWDFNLVFGELKKIDDKIFIEQTVAITMSPQHAKALAGVLAGNVKEYEKQVGEIKLPQPADAIGPTTTGPQPKAPASVGFKT